MLTIRQAFPSDCDAMCEVHRTAIVRHYSPTHGDQAAHALAASIHADLCAFRMASEMTIVAEEPGRLLGFAQFDGGSGRIEMCVVPEAEKRAIASALLAVIETEARSRGLGALLLCAMLNSESLYLPYGFAVIGKGEIALGNDVRIPGVRMEKQLQYSEPRAERRRAAMAGMSAEVDRDGDLDA